MFISHKYMLLATRSIVIVSYLTGITGISGLLCNRSAATEDRSGVFAMDLRKELDLATPRAAVAVAWSIDGSELAATSDYGNVLTVWDKAGHIVNQIRRTGDGPALGSLAFANGSSQLLFAPPNGAPKSTALSIWDVASGKIIGALDGPNSDLLFGNRTPLFQISPDQKILAGGNSSRGKNSVIVYSADGWKPLQKSDAGSVFSICVFGNGRLVGVGSIDGHANVIDIATGTQNKLQGYEESKFGGTFFEAIAGNPAGTLLFLGIGPIGFSGDYYKSTEAQSWMNSFEPVRVLRVKDGTVMSSAHLGIAPIRSAVWDPLGRYVAFVDSTSSLYIWQPTEDGSPYEKVGLSSQSLSVAISPDGNNIATTTNSGVSIFAVK